MNRVEFLGKLKEALENDLQGHIVEEQLIYYNQYIRSEVAKGRDEEEIIGELGDPWALAKTVIDSVELQGNTYGSNVTDMESDRGFDEGNAENLREDDKENSGKVSWWRLILIAIILLLFVAGVITLIAGIFSLLLPILIPMFVVIVILRFLGKE